jgi:acetyltransferase-like isoleucine patch superfamily enzyme
MDKVQLSATVRCSLRIVPLSGNVGLGSSVAVGAGVSVTVGTGVIVGTGVSVGDGTTVGIDVSVGTAVAGAGTVAFELHAASNIMTPKKYAKVLCFMVTSAKHGLK